MDLLYPREQDDKSDDDESATRNQAHNTDDEQDPTSTALPLGAATQRNLTSSSQPNPNPSTSSAGIDNSRPSSNVATPNNGSPSNIAPPSHASSETSTFNAPPSSLALAMANRGNILTPQTPPPSSIRPPFSLSPPSPPGRRFAGGLGREQHLERTTGDPNASRSDHSSYGTTTPTNQQQQQQQQQQQHPRGPPNLVPPPPPPPGMQPPASSFSIMTRTLEHGGSSGGAGQGRFVPHVVTISLDTSPLESRDGSSAASLGTRSAISTPTFSRPRLGQLLEACPLDGAKASAVTCVKFSPSCQFCLIGYGVREPMVEHNGNHYHPVTALYRVRGGMTHVSTMLSGDDDVNIARFHPQSGYGFVYGTKQGRVRVLSPRPWNFYNC